MVSIENLKMSDVNMKFVDCAIAYSLDSPLKHRHGCIVAKGGKMISGYHNTPRSKWSGGNRCSTHAEMAALLRLRRKCWVLRGFKEKDFYKGVGRRSLCC